MEPSARFGPPFRALLLHHFVTFAGRHFQLGPVDDVHMSALVGYQAGFLKNSCSNRDNGPERAQNSWHKTPGSGKDV